MVLHSPVVVPAKYPILILLLVSRTSKVPSRSKILVLGSNVNEVSPWNTPGIPVAVITLLLMLPLIVIDPAPLFKGITSLSVPTTVS